MSVTDTAEARLRAIFEQARGADGSLGPQAQTNALAVGYLRWAPFPLEDPRVENDAYDRAYNLRWSDGPRLLDGQGAYNPTLYEEHTVQMNVGYLHGPKAVDDLLLRRGAETGDYCRAHGPKRAQDDETRLLQALAHPAIYQVTSDDPALQLVRPVAPGVTVDLGGGRLLRQFSLTVLLLRRNAPY